jgi:hypothetical protein
MTPTPITMPAVDIMSFITPLLTWGVPIIATLFAIKWGLSLVFGRKR